MTELDHEWLGLLHRHIGRWPVWDRVVIELAINDLTKGALLMVAWFWAWFRPRPTDRRRPTQLYLLGLLLTMLVVLAANRGLASALEHRPRPLHDPAYTFTPPPGLKPHAFGHLSSFPSDHAVLFVGMAVGIAGVSPGIGIPLLLLNLVFVLLPRLYLGLHYPSDMIVGAALGLVAVASTHWWCRHPRLLEWLRNQSERRPGAFHATLFALAYGYATLFHPVVKWTYAIKDLLGDR